MTCSSTHEPNKLHTELPERNKGSARSGLKATLPGRGREEEELGRDTLGPLVQPPARALPHLRAEQKAAQRLQSLPGRLAGSRCTGMASCCHRTCRGPGFPPLTARPAGGLPSLGTLTAPLQGTSPTAWPSSCVAPNLRPGAGGPGRGGVRSQLDQEAPTSQGEESSDLHATPAHIPPPGCQFYGWGGAVLGHRDINAHGHISGSNTPPHRASPLTLPTADTAESLTLGGWARWRGGNGMDWEASLSSFAF